jgi:hypothetical protein
VAVSTAASAGAVEQGGDSGMGVTGYGIDTGPWDGVGDEIGKDDPRWSVKGEGQGIANRSKSNDQTDGNTTDLEAIDVYYGHNFFGGRHRRFGHILERMRLESQTSDSQSQIELAIKLIAEKLQDLQNLIRTETSDSVVAPLEAINHPDSQAAPSIDQSVTNISGMLQHIEEIYPGFIDSLKGDLGVTGVDNSVSDQAVLLALLEELYEQIDLYIDRITPDDPAGQYEGIEQLQAHNDGVADAIADLKERIASQINQIDALAPGFSNKVRPFVEKDLAYSKESDPNQILYDALEELSRLLEDVVAMLNDHFEGNNLTVTDILPADTEEAVLLPKVQHDENAEVQGDSVTTQEDNIAFAAPSDVELESEAVEVFMGIYDQLSDEARSEVAQILVGMTFDEETLGQTSIV